MKKTSLIVFAFIAIITHVYSQENFCENSVKKIVPEMDNYYADIRSENGIGSKIKIYKCKVKFAACENMKTVIGKEDKKWTLNIDLLEHATFEEAKTSFKSYKEIISSCLAEGWTAIESENTDRFIREKYYLKNNDKSNQFVELIVSGINDINKVTLTFKVFQE